MPLARYAMYAWGMQIYVAATWDRGELGGRPAAHRERGARSSHRGV